MSVAELQELEEVKGLITRGLQIGVLTYAEIATATAELGLEETDDPCARNKTGSFVCPPCGPVRLRKR